ncbi:MAG TPA: glycosyl hydrolase family 28-related protein [Sphingomonas sp.]|nr:glycosyl hydrolase family 28-related protein [Sphingomonas sp.]
MAVASLAFVGAGAPASAASAASSPSAQSAFLSAPADPRAVTVQGRGDGVADDTAAIQRAIDAAASSKGREGIVFLPAGRYRISRTVYIWPGVRLFGVGKTRPVITLGAATPGFQAGVGTMVFFTGPRAGTPGAPPKVPISPRTSVPFNPTIGDANSGTFYSAMGNVDFEIGDGNPAATAVRFHMAQHAYLSHIDFHIGSGLAGIYQVGNIGQDLRFFGGRYGILTEKTSPAWQYTLLDSTFEGQRDAAIREHEAGLTLVNTSIRNVPVGLEIDRGYGDWLWGKDVRFENVSNAAVVISNEDTVYTQIGFENATASGVPTFARFRDSGKTVSGQGARYRFKAFTYGLTLPGLGAPGVYETRVDAAPIVAMPKRVQPAIRSLPPVAQWFDVRGGGAKGDDATDDTAAIQRAIDTHRVVYFPTGFYRVSQTLTLRPDTVLIGLHPDLTQIVLADDTPAFRGIGAAKGLIESAKGGDAIVSGIGLFTGGVNPRATGLLWKAGATSLVDDVRFHGGHGSNRSDGSRLDPYNANHTADADPGKRWDGQYASLSVTDGGGGTFSNIWTPNTYAAAGLHVSNTSTPGHVYEMSAEHHGRAEIVLDGVKNWEFLAPQTEEEAGESRNTVSLEIRNSSNILFANYHAYRVTRSIQPARTAVRLFNPDDIRFRNVHVNAESGLPFCDAEGCATDLRASKFPYENAIQDMTTKQDVREREFAVLDVKRGAAPIANVGGPVVRKLEDGFYSIAGAAVDAKGKLYFVEHNTHRIYGWTAGDGLSVAADAPLDPVNLAVDRSGNLMVLSSDGAAGTVYSLKPGHPESIAVIAPTPAVAHGDASVAVPGNFWVNGEFKDQIDPVTYRFTTLAEMFVRDMGVAKAREYVSPDGSLVLPAYRTVQQGPPNHLGWRFSDALDTYGFVMAKPGARLFVSNGSEGKTYSGRIGAGGSLTDLTPFANRGGESVAVGPDGRVYIANGQVFVHAADGRETARIDVPERPLQLIFGGAGGRTLFILTHHALYAVET